MAMPRILSAMGSKTVAQNRRARFDYEILETIEAGIILAGQEVKSARLGNVNLSGSYVAFAGGTPILRHAKIAPYAFASNIGDYDPGRDRQLLLKKPEQEKLAALTAEKGVTIVPLEVRAGKYMKVLLGVARGRKRFDKRETIKKRDIDKRLRQTGDF